MNLCVHICHFVCIFFIYIYRTTTNNNSHTNKTMKPNQHRRIIVWWNINAPHQYNRHKKQQMNLHTHTHFCTRLRDVNAQLIEIHEYIEFMITIRLVGILCVGPPKWHLFTFRVIIWLKCFKTTPYIYFKVLNWFAEIEHFWIRSRLMEYRTQIREGLKSSMLKQDLKPTNLA